MDHGDQDEKRMGSTPEGKLVELKSANSGDQGEGEVPDEIEKVTFKTWVVVIVRPSSIPCQPYAINGSLASPS